MPTVPQYRETQRIGPAPEGKISLNGKALALASGEGTWHALARAGEVMSRTSDQFAKIGLDQLREHNQTVAMEKITEAEKRIQALQLEQGKRQGANALGSEDGTTSGVADAVSQELDKIRAELGSGMNDAQKRMFDPVFQRRALWASGWAGQHEARQREVWQTSAENGLMATQAERGLNNIANPAEFSAARGNIASVMERRGQREGWDAAYTKAATDEALRKALYAPALKAMIGTGELGTARGFLKQFRDDIGPEMAGTFETAIKNEAERLQAKAEANRRKAVAETLEELEDAKYSAQYMGDTSQLADMAKTLRQLGDTKRADALSRQVALWKTNDEARDIAVKAPLGELASSVADLDRRMEEGRKNGMGVEAFQKLAQQREAMAGIYASRASALKNDPAQAADSAPGVVAPDNATLSDKVALRLTYQAENGLPELKRKPLTGGEAERLREQWHNASPDQRAVLLYGEEGILKRFGAHALPVLNQIGVSPFEQDLAHSVLENPDGASNARTVFKVLALEEKDIPAQSVTNELHEVLESSSVYQGMRQMALSTSSPQAARAAKQFEQAASRLLRLGRDPEEARRILDNGRQGVADANMALTVPAGRSTAAVERGLARALEKKLPDMLAEHPVFSPLEREERLRQLRHAGLWVNAPGGDGYTLLDAVTGLPVTDGKGNMLTVKSEELFRDAAFEEEALEDMDWISNGLTGAY